jgi:hypothetical protein
MHVRNSGWAQPSVLMAAFLWPMGQEFGERLSTRATPCCLAWAQKIMGAAGLSNSVFESSWDGSVDGVSGSTIFFAVRERIEDQARCFSHSRLTALREEFEDGGQIIASLHDCGPNPPLGPARERGDTDPDHRARILIYAGRCRGRRPRCEPSLGTSAHAAAGVL